MSTEKGESALFDEMYGDTENNDSENKIKAQMLINKVKYLQINSKLYNN